MQNDIFPVFEATPYWYQDAPRFNQMNHSDPKCMLMKDYEGNHSGPQVCEAIEVNFDWHENKKPRQSNTAASSI